MTEARHVYSCGDENEGDTSEPKRAKKGDAIQVDVAENVGEVETGLRGPFQKDFESEELEDDYEEDEQGPAKPLETRQREAEEAGMIQVGPKDWQSRVLVKLSEITSEILETRSEFRIKDDLRAVEEVIKAICSVRRGHNSQDRLREAEEKVGHHKGKAREADSKETKIKQKMEEKKALGQPKAAKDRTTRIGYGTGLLLCSGSFRYTGYLVITNNHIIMNEEEAKRAEVVFDYLVDGSEEGIRKYKVDRLFASSPRTKSSKDEDTLDFSILALRVEAGDDFLEDRGMHGVWSDTDLLKYKELPLIMVGHPQNLGMRISVGRNAALAEGRISASHIKHNLPSQLGSSGSGLLRLLIDDEGFSNWQAAFLHYRHRRAVSLQAIVLKVVELLKVS